MWKLIYCECKIYGYYFKNYSGIQETSTFLLPAEHTGEKYTVIYKLSMAF